MIQVVVVRKLLAYKPLTKLQFTSSVARVCLASVRSYAIEFSNQRNAARQEKDWLDRFVMASTTAGPHKEDAFPQERRFCPRVPSSRLGGRYRLPVLLSH